MLLAALRRKMQDVAHPDADDLKKYLRSGQFGGKKHLKIKLQASDEKILESLVDNPAQHDKKSICQANIAFHDAMSEIWGRLERVATKAAQEAVSAAEVFTALAQRVLNHVEIVKITALTEKDAFRLFETLNDRGMPLSAADLIKNKLFSQIALKDGDQLPDLQESWQSVTTTFDLIDSDDRPDMATFLRHYWIGMQKEVRKDDLYDEFAETIKGHKAIDCLKLVDDIADSARVYCHLSHPHVDLPLGVDWFRSCSSTLKRLAVFRARVSPGDIGLREARAGQDSVAPDSL